MSSGQGAALGALKCKLIRTQAKLDAISLGLFLAVILFPFFKSSFLWADALKDNCLTALTSASLIERSHWSPTGRFALKYKDLSTGQTSFPLELFDSSQKLTLPLETIIPEPYEIFSPLDDFPTKKNGPLVSWSIDERYVALQLLIWHSRNHKKLREVALIFDTFQGQLVAVPGFTLDKGHRINKILFDGDIPQMATVLFRHEYYIDITAQVWNLASSDLLGEWTTNRVNRIDALTAGHYEALTQDAVIRSTISEENLTQNSTWLSPDGSYSLWVRPDRQALQLIRVVPTTDGQRPFKIHLLQELALEVNSGTELYWLKNGQIFVAHNGERAWYWHRDKGQPQTFAADQIVFHDKEMVTFLKSPDSQKPFEIRGYHIETMEEL